MIPFPLMPGRRSSRKTIRPAPGLAPAVPARPVATLAPCCPLSLPVADANPANLKLAQMMMLRLGYRTDPAGDRSWIIALTADAMSEDREQALAAGRIDFLTKPFRTELPATAIERAHQQLTRPAA